MNMIRYKPINAGKAALYIAIMAVSLVFIYPLIYTLLASLKSNHEIFSNYFGLPRTFHFENYGNAWVKGNIGKYFFNTLFVCGTYVVLAILFSTMAAFVMARLKSGWLKFVFYFFVAGMMIPIHAILIPLAQISVTLDASNNFFFLISIYIAGGIPYMIFVITGFMRSLPAELEEAAIMDGGGLATIYTRVILPLSKPAVSTMAILGFLSSWNDLILALLFLKREAMRTLSLGLMNFTGFFTADYAGISAAIIIVNIPTLIIYLMLQEYVEKGLTAGAVKGERGTTIMEDWKQLDRYNVEWTTPGRTDRGSMPIGNGEVALNVWVEQDGDLQFYMARTDALTELDRNVKLGKVRVRLTPNPFRRGAKFRQELRLRDGIIVIEAGEGAGRIRLRIFVDAGSPAIYVTGECSAPTRISAVYETWRNAPRPSGSDSPLGERSKCGISESPDVVRNDGDRVLFYHRNGETCVRAHAGLQGVIDYLDRIPDSLANRTFGGVMSMPGAVALETGTLEKAAEATFALIIATHSAQAPRLDDWIRELYELHAGLPETSHAFSRTTKWWNAYWRQSWIFVEGDEPGAVETEPKLLELDREPFPEPSATPSAATRAYVLTKWMTACAGRGNFPILFNGSLFTVMPGGNQHYSTDKFDNFAEVFTSMPAGEPDLAFNPDERAWTHMNLWQNVRLSYQSMPARGEADMMRPLFRYYRRFWELNRARAHVFYGAEGQYNTEITTSFGLMPGWVFGLDRDHLPAGYAENRHGGAVEISPGLELIKMMLDYCEFTSDEAFLRDELLPYAKALFRFIETRFTKRQGGKIVLEPIHAVETFWDTRDSMPVVAGMHAVLGRILALPRDSVPDYEYFASIRAITPDIPIETVGEKEVLAPAREYEPRRQNVELPELYAVHPFELYGLQKPDLRMAIDSFYHALAVSGAYRPYIMGRGPVDGQYYASYSGWQQIGMNAALLGLTEEAQTVLAHNCQLYNPGFRFPAMWGPVYDCVPDIDHGANILNTLQLMAFQVDGDTIIVLPAWPKGWNVSFKFHAPGNTTVECEYRAGKVTKLNVHPPERREDVKFGEGISAGDDPS